MAKRVFLIVLDSFGVGAAPDAAAFGDAGTNTLGSVAATGLLDVPNMKKLGLFNLDGVTAGEKEEHPLGAFARLQEKSQGKDTTIGHWELAGIVSKKPMPTFPEGFPPQCIEAFEKAVGRKVLCNKPYSGTAVIRDYGEEHMKTGSLIVYTSADSVFQIAAHEEVVPLEELYDICRKARKLLTGDWAVGRVIARPFVGSCAQDFTRTGNRHDFSLEPTGKTVMDYIKESGRQVLTVGKISDIFAGVGVSESFPTKGNEEGIRETLRLAEKEFEGLAFINLVDYDMLYGHRRDPEGYAKALNVFDAALPELMAKLGEEDLLMITADHGCDPAYSETTDHTREYIPWLVWGKEVQPGLNLGTRLGFDTVGATVAGALGLETALEGENLWPAIKKQ